MQDSMESLAGFHGREEQRKECANKRVCMCACTGMCACRCSVPQLVGFSDKRTAGVKKDNEGVGFTVL